MSARKLGRYCLERKIATGGMAEIWLARQDGPAGFQKELVVKRILPHLVEDPKFTAMFLDEARLAAKLTHPNIVQIFDLGEAGGEYYIAMEFIDGRDLQALLDRAACIGQPIPSVVAARIVADAAIALDYAHTFVDRDGTAVQLVHRDVSPQNILVSRDGIIKIVDFGVAKAATSSHKTQTGAVKGKLSYMAPEQISGKPIDARTDVFALGIVLYELVTGRRPFGHESELLAITAILNEAPPRPCAIVDDVPPDLEVIILRALEKRPEDRFASAADMHVALEQVLRQAGALITARDLSRWVEDLFSPEPRGLLAVQPGGQKPGIVTHADHPSATTRPSHRPASADAAPDTEGRWAGAAVAPPVPSPDNEVPWARAAVAPAAHPSATPADAAPAEVSAAPPERSHIAIAIVVVLLGLVVGAAALLWKAMSSTDPPEVATGSDAAVADVAVVADTAPEAAGAVDPPAPDLAPSPPAVPDDKPPGPEKDAGDEPDPVATGSDAGPALPEPADTTPVVRAPEDVPARAPAADTAPTPPGADTGPSAPVVQQGEIRVVVRGGRHTVFIDGRQVGRLPGAGRYPAAAGRRTVRVVADDGSEVTRQVSVSAGQMAIVRVGD